MDIFCKCRLRSCVVDVVHHNSHVWMEIVLQILFYRMFQDLVD